MNNVIRDYSVPLGLSCKGSPALGYLHLNKRAEMVGEMLVFVASLQNSISECVTFVFVSYENFAPARNRKYNN